MTLALALALALALRTLGAGALWVYAMGAATATLSSVVLVPVTAEQPFVKAIGAAPVDGGPS